MAETATLEKQDLQIKGLPYQIGDFYKIPPKKIEKALQRVCSSENLTSDNEHAKTHKIIDALIGPSFQLAERSQGKKLENTKNAVSEILTQSFLHKNLSTKEFLDGIYSGEIKIGNEDETRKMLLLIYTFPPVGNAFTIEDLSKCFFVDNSEFAYKNMFENIVNRADKKLGAKAAKLLLNDLKSEKN